MRPTTTLALLVTIGFALACGKPAPTEPDYATPDLGTAKAGDAEEDVVDRATALEGALPPDQAPDGEALDMSAQMAGFALTIDSKSEVGSLQDEAPPERSATYQNVWHGVAMAAIADAATLLVVAPPAAAIDIVGHGVVGPIGKNLWGATNTVTDSSGRSVTGLFVVAWVGVGWVCEMRLWTSDGEYDNTRWFDGFVSADRHLGWWDLYDVSGTNVGVVEWADDGLGNAEFGIAATSGDSAGNLLTYTFADTGDAYVAYHDHTGSDYWVSVNADKSGSEQAPDFNGGAEACWAAADDATAPYADIACE